MFRSFTRKTRVGLAGLAVLVVVAGLALGGATAAHAARGITLKGSDTMVILGQRWAETYMRGHRGRVIQVTGGGSGTGIAALINGTTDICMSSRPMKEAERLKLRERFQTRGIEIPVAKDGLTVYVHDSNPVRQLTLEQLRDAYLGKITNWKDLGGPDAAITLYGRENSSGTYVYFKDAILQGRDFAPRTQTLPGTAAVVNAVTKDPGSIGYGGIAYGGGVKQVGIAGPDGTAVDASEATIKDGTYALSRPLYWYLTVKTPESGRAMLTWVTSPEGQAAVTEVGYFPVN